MGILRRAFAYSLPVLPGYLAIGIAFGLLLAGAGYPWPLALVMSLFMYAGAGQYLAVGLFAAGAGLWEALLVQLVVNARHLAYGLSMERRFRDAGPLKLYLIFALTDETFALLSSLDDEAPGDRAPRATFMFYVALLDQGYWTAGSLIGALAGALLPFDLGGVEFALTALFIVLMIEQIRPQGGLYRAETDYQTTRISHKPAPNGRPFIISGAAAILAAIFLPERFSLLSALALSLALIPLLEKRGKPGKGGPREEEPW